MQFKDGEARCAECVEMGVECPCGYAVTHCVCECGYKAVVVEARCNDLPPGCPVCCRFLEPVEAAEGQP